jgi:hypothetical protein
MKLKGSCTKKEMVPKLKRQSTKWEKIFANYISNKGSITKIYRTLKKLNSPKINDPMRQWANDLNRIFFKGRCSYG